MISHEIRREIQNIVRGIIQEGEENTCSTARNLLCRSFGTSPTAKTQFESRAILKEKQVGFLKQFAQKSGIWNPSLPAQNRYLASGGEAVVYFAEDGRNVIKTNDAGYYATWTEFFNSLVLHNLFFPATKYSLLGFTEDERGLLAILQQPYIKGGQASLLAVEAFLKFNGFEKRVRQDYYNHEFGLALEDMHDENVILKDEHLFFIDTIFYIMEIK